jgi:hypothetical protein
MVHPMALLSVLDLSRITEGSDAGPALPNSLDLARHVEALGYERYWNLELPNVPEDYMHRVGRTAPAGAAGIGIAFCSNEERPCLGAPSRS